MRPGCFLGYRPSIREGVGTWVARAYDDELRAYRLKAIGAFSSLSGRDRFVVAKKEAEDFAALADRRIELAAETVRDACEQYAVGNAEADGRFKRHVYPDPLAKVKLSKLWLSHLKAWRQRLEERPALVTTRVCGANSLSSRNDR